MILSAGSGPNTLRNWQTLEQQDSTVSHVRILRVGIETGLGGRWRYDIRRGVLNGRNLHFFELSPSSSEEAPLVFYGILMCNMHHD